jgi:hypothetical protein
MVVRGMVVRGNVVRGTVVRGNVVRGSNIDPTEHVLEAWNHGALVLLEFTCTRYILSLGILPGINIKRLTSIRYITFSRA